MYIKDCIEYHAIINDPLGLLVYKIKAMFATRSVRQVFVIICNYSNFGLTKLLAHVKCAPRRRNYGKRKQ